MHAFILVSLKLVGAKICKHSLPSDLGTKQETGATSLNKKLVPHHPKS